MRVEIVSKGKGESMRDSGFHWRYRFIFCVFLFVILLIVITGCEKGGDMKKMIQVTYTVDSGAILPELQWHEEYIITGASVTLARNGKMEGTMVNEGQWIIETDQASLTALFSTLNNIDLNAIVKVEPQDIPDGAGSERYILVDDKGGSFSLDYTPGVTYENGNLVTQPVQEFIDRLELPEEATAQFLLQ